jgi:DNA-binding protein HU-beta
MNKAELITAVSDKSELSKAQTQACLDSFFEVVAKALKKNDKVSIVGFGTFSARKRAARMGRNPKTGAALKIAASKNPTFKAGKALKDSIK